MTTSIHFDHFNCASEQNLIEDLTIELIQLRGIDMNFIPRDIIREDDLFNEETFSRFQSEFTIEMYIESVDGFGGDGDFLSKFGLEIRDQATFVVSRRRFNEELDQSIRKRPLEGDLVYFPLTNSLFEITFVEHDNPFYERGKNYTYSLTVELFTYRNQELNTGISEIDEVEDRLYNDGIDIIDPFGDNDTIQTEAENIIDTTENDPFGGF